MTGTGADSMVLTIPEIMALVAGGDYRAGSAARALGIGGLDAEVALAGLSSLFARGFIESVDTEPAVAAPVRAIVGVIAESAVTVRMCRAAEQSSSVAHIYSSDLLGVLVRPIGFGCFRFGFVELSRGISAVIRTTAENVLRDGSGGLLLEVLYRDSNSVAMMIQRTDQGWSIAEAESFTLAEPDGDRFWSGVFDLLKIRPGDGG